VDVTAGKKWMLLQGRRRCYCREEVDVTAGKKWMLLQGRRRCYFISDWKPRTRSVGVTVLKV